MLVLWHRGASSLCSWVEAPASLLRGIRKQRGARKHRGALETPARLFRGALATMVPNPVFMIEVLASVL